MENTNPLYNNDFVCLRFSLQFLLKFLSLGLAYHWKKAIMCARHFKVRLSPTSDDSCMQKYTLFYPNR